MCGTVCGDGIQAGNEECDDGNADDSDYCSEKCVVNFVKLSTGAIVGVVVGGVALLAIIIGAVMIYRRNTAPVSTGSPTAPSDGFLKSSSTTESQNNIIKNIEPIDNLQWCLFNKLLISLSKTKIKEK